MNNPSEILILEICVACATMWLYYTQKVVTFFMLWPLLMMWYCLFAIFLAGESKDNIIYKKVPSALVVFVILLAVSLINGRFMEENKPIEL